MHMPQVPKGSGTSPVTMIVLGVDDVDAAAAFYRAVFGWQLQRMAPEMAIAMPASGPMVTIRATSAGAASGTVPFIHVADVDGAIASMVAHGGSLERAPWTTPMAGALARVRDASGTLWGVMSGVAATADHVPMPFGQNPRPPANTVCSLEMYAADGERTAATFAALFGWATLPTMPQFVAFDAGAGIGGVWQSHTPAMPAVAYVYVDDVGVTLGAIERHGGKRTSDAMSMPGMATFGYFTDVAGINMGLIGR